MRSTLFTVLLLPVLAYAQGLPIDKPNPPPVFEGVQEAIAASEAASEAAAEAAADAQAEAAAISESVSASSTGDQSLSIRGRSQVPDGYFNYTPNFIDCGRVIGLQFGNTNGIGSLGIPLPRDKACDVWKAVQEAQENGHILLSYAFMCEVPNIRRVWGVEKCNQLVGLADDWFESALGGESFEVSVEDLPDPFFSGSVQGGVQVEESEAFQALEAQVSDLTSALSSTSRELEALRGEYAGAVRRYRALAAESRDAMERQKATIVEQQVLYEAEVAEYETVAKETDDRWERQQKQLRQQKAEFRATFPEGTGG